MWRLICGDREVMTRMWRLRCGDWEVKTKMWKLICDDWEVKSKIWWLRCENQDIVTEMWRKRLGSEIWWLNWDGHCWISEVWWLASDGCNIKIPMWCLEFPDIDGITVIIVTYSLQGLRLGIYILTNSKINMHTEKCIVPLTCIRVISN